MAWAGVYLVVVPVWVGIFAVILDPWAEEKWVRTMHMLCQFAAHSACTANPPPNLLPPRCGCGCCPGDTADCFCFFFFFVFFFF